MTITISPAAGPLIVSSELLISDVTIAPTMAVNTPAIGGKPLAIEMPRHNGKAIRNTKNPDIKSCGKYFPKPRRSPRGMSVSDGLLAEG